jgi:CHAT domain-containing protein
VAVGWIALWVGVLAAVPGSGEPAGSCPAPGAETTAAAAETDPAAAALARGNELAAGGDAAGALAAYAEARALAREGGDDALAAAASANAARAAVAAQDAATAARELDAAQASAQALADPRVRARLLVQLGRSWAELAARRPAAPGAAKRAAEVLTLAAKQARGAGDARLESYALGWLGALYERDGRLDDALGLTRRALDVGMRADAPDALYRWQWQLGRLQRASGRPDEALEAYRQAAATLAQLRQQGAAAGAELAAGTGGSDELYLGLVELLLEREAKSGDEAQRQALLREALATLESQKVEELRDYFRDECLAAQNATAPDAIPGTLVVYPVALGERLELIAGGAGGLVRHSVPVGREAFVQEVRALRHKLARRTTREYLRHADRLYEWLIRPLAPMLEAHRPRTLVFVPSGPLRTIPFGALHDARRGEFLIEQFPVAILPGLSLTDPRPLPRGSLRLLAAGISEAVGGYPAVARVRDELAAVHGAFPGKLLEDSGFAVASFVDEVEEHPFGVVHIASHAQFEDDPAESFLLAYDGRISMERLASTVGATRFRTVQPLELLALSACETAAGNDRAALGLAGIALRSGARSALATLWSVNDEAAAKLVTGFYRSLADPALTRAEALQQAQLALVRTREYAHPALWSPFVLISNWL